MRIPGPFNHKQKPEPSRAVPKEPCVHHTEGRIGFRMCTHDHQCSNCEFDQFMQDKYAVRAVVKPVNLMDVKGVKLPQGVYLHPGHMWTKLEEADTVRIGLDDFARRVFGPVDRIVAPLVGKTVVQGRADISFICGPKRGKLLSPVGGVVTAVNMTLRDTAGPANDDPYAEGWILRVYAGNLRKDIKDLMIGSESRAFMEKEIDCLQRLLEGASAPLDAGGGNLGDTIYGKLPQLGWNRLVRFFLHS